MSNDVFQIFCNNCGSKLNAKVGLIGQTRNCPKCQSPILIQRAEPSSPPALSTTGAPVGSSSILVNEPSITDRVTGPTLGGGAEPIPDLPRRLQFRNRYLVMDSDRIVAVWETGKGWQINVGNGFASARKNMNAIPDQGAFVLVEIVIGSVDDDSMVGGGPRSLHLFKVSQRGALTSLYRDESEILEKVDGVTTLTNNQKSALMNYIRQHFMFESLAGSQGLLDSLSMS